MWPPEENRRKKYSTLRAWFIALVLLGLVTAFIGVCGLIWLRWHYGGLAEKIDLSQLQEMETASIVFDRNGHQLGKIYTQNRDTISREQMPPYIFPALICAEDARFYQHSGVDYYGIIRAAVMNWKSGRMRQGASTITQQLARNSFPDALPPSDRSLQRKLLEIFVAQRIEKNYTKDQILECYLNRVFFGFGFHGLEAAARGYFGKPAKELTLSECAALTGILRSPSRFSPWRDRNACIATRAYVLKRMLELGWIKKAEYESAMKETLAVKNRSAIYSKSYAEEFVCQQVKELLEEDVNVSQDGFRIYTTLDAKLQRTAEESLKKHLESVERHRDFKHPTHAQYDVLYRNRDKRPENSPLPSPKYLQGALYALDNATGGVLALVGGRDYSHSQYNRVLLSNRAAGTAFLPITYAAAFEKGIFPGSVFQDAAFDNRLVMIGGLTGVLGEWGPENMENLYEGPITAHAALMKSKNSATVRVGLATGLDPVCELAQRAGIEHELRRYPSTYLGSSEVTLEELTLAFTMFPNLGERPKKAYIVTRIESKDGRVIYEQSASPMVPTLSPSTAWQIHAALAESLERGSAEKAYTRFGLKKAPFGGKTGTAYNFTDLWFIGYSSAITCGVWAGFDTPTSIYMGAFSNETVMPVWIDFMNASLADFPAQPIHRPPELEVYEICRLSGQLLTPQCVVGGHSTGIQVWGTLDQAPKVDCQLHDESRGFLKEQLPDEDGIPRPVLAVDLSKFQPVELKASAVTGNDPFNTVTSSSKPAPPIEQSSGEQVIRPETVRPLDTQENTDSTIKLEAPEAIKFE